MMEYKCEQCQRRTCTVTGPVSDFAPDGCLRFSCADSEWRKVEPAEPDEPIPYVESVWIDGAEYFTSGHCPDCAKYRRLSAEKNNIIRSINEEKDSEIRHLRGMLRQAAEECTGCASLRDELAHCESALIDCQDRDAGMADNIDVVLELLKSWEPK